MKRALLFTLTVCWLQIQAQPVCPPPGADPPSPTCPGPVVCGPFNDYCAEMPPQVGPDQVFPGCPSNVINNPQYFGFYAGSTNFGFVITGTNCLNGLGLHGGIYDASCNPVTTACPCSPGGYTLQTNSLIIGQQYFVLVDGCAGDICDYTVTLTEGQTLEGPPPDPTGPVIGQTTVCPGLNVPYIIPPVPATDDYLWSITPPIGVITGNPNSNIINIDWTDPGTAQVCVLVSNVCGPNPNPFCFDVTVDPPPMGTDEMDICLGECEPYPGNGELICNPGAYQITLPGASYLGCDSTVFLTVLPVVVPPSFDTVTACAGYVHFQCNQVFDESGLFNPVCESYQGCDSTINLNLLILDPQAVVGPYNDIGCGADSIITLDGSGSSQAGEVAGYAGTTSYSWTGPGIITPADSAIIQVNAPGQYCLTVTHERQGVACTDTECVDVIENIQFPNAPDIAIDASTPCAGGGNTFTADNPTGPGVTQYTWTNSNGDPITVTSGAPGDTIQIDWSGTGTTQVCVTPENDCGVGPTSCIDVTISEAPATPQIAGVDSLCSGTTHTFSVTNPDAGPNPTYSWSATGGASITGSGPSVDVDFTGVAVGDYQVCVTMANDCGDASNCFDVNVNDVPEPPAFQPNQPTDLCDSDPSLQSYCIDPVLRADTYTWTTPNGTFTVTNTCWDVDWTGLTGGTVCVTADNECGSTAPICLDVVIDDGPTAALDGTVDFCSGDPNPVSLTITLTGQAPWTVDYTIDGTPQTPLVINSSPFDLQTNTPGAYVLTNVSDPTGCPGTVSGQGTVVENALPTAQLSGGGDICQGSGDVVPLTIDLTGAAPWTVEWLVDGTPQTPLNVNASPFTLNIPEAQAGQITLGTVTDANGCQNSGAGTAQVIVNDAPQVSNVQVSCNATATAYRVTFTISGGDPASYSVTPFSGSFDVSGTVFTSDSIPQGLGYSFVVSDANDCNPVTVSDPQVDCPCNTLVGDMGSALIEECGEGPVTAPYDDASQFLDPDDELLFALHEGAGNTLVNVLAWNDAPTFSFDPATMQYGTTYYISAVVGNQVVPGVIDLNDRCLQVAVGTPVVFYEIPGAVLDGSQAICNGETANLTVTFTGTGPWSIEYQDDQGNVVQLSNITDNPLLIPVNPNDTTTYTLTDVRTATCVGPADGSATVLVNRPPEVINVIEQCNFPLTHYTVTFTIVGGDPSSYTVSGHPGTLTGNTFVSDEIPKATTYQFIVDDGNGCGPVVFGQFVDCVCGTEVGSFQPDPQEFCGAQPVSATGLYLGGEVLDSNDVLCFLLHTGDPFNPIATNPNEPVFPFDPGTMAFETTYFVSAIAGNDDGSGCVDLIDPCRIVSNDVPVVWHEIPSAVLLGDADICAGESTDLTFTFTGNPPWTFTYQDDQGNVFTETTSNPNHTITLSPNQTTAYTLLDVSDANCPGDVSGAAVVGVHRAPQVVNVERVCDATNDFFHLEVTLQGGDPATYMVSGGSGTFSGNVFISEDIPNEGSYQFFIDDAFGCGPIEISGAFACDCDTNAGAMTGQDQGCGPDDLVQGFHDDTNLFLDPDDNLIFVLHDAAGNILGNILATGTTPEFGFIPGVMNFGQTYYISAVAGDGDGQGGVDFDDLCLHITAGTPVVFYELPTIDISQDLTVCSGDEAKFVLSMTGTGPYDVVYNDGNSDITLNNVPNGQTITLHPTQTTTLTLVSVTDLGTGCSNSAGASATAFVNQPVSAGVALGDFEVCFGDGTIINLADTLSGADPGGQWLDASGNPVSGTFNTAGVGEGTYLFTYTVDGPDPCPDDAEQVAVVVHPLPTADAGEDQELNCSVTEVEIGGPGSSTGNVTYTWNNGLGNEPFPLVTTPGTYSLTVTDNETGCSDEDEVVVTLSDDIPEPIFALSDVSCFGEHDGFIILETVTGGSPPYEYSFNGGPFSSQSQFTNLSAGTYTIVVRDSKGCEFSTAFAIGEPEELLVELINDLEDENIATLGDSVRITVLVSIPFDSLDEVIWTPAVFCDTCESFFIHPTQQMSFSVTVRKGVCTATDKMTLFVRKERPVYIPNAFSPDGDGTNDLFRIYAGNSVTRVKRFLIFNRWGEPVFTLLDFDPNDKDAGWDGTHRGQPMNPAVFTWFAEIEFTDGEVELFKGDVVLMR